MHEYLGNKYEGTDGWNQADSAQLLHQAESAEFNCASIILQVK